MQDLHPGNILVRERALSGNGWFSRLAQNFVQLPPKVVFLGELSCKGCSCAAGHL